MQLLKFRLKIFRNKKARIKLMVKRKLKLITKNHKKLLNRFSLTKKFLEKIKSLFNHRIK